MKRLRRAPGGFLLIILLVLLIYILGWSHLLALKKIVIHGTTAQTQIQQSLAEVKPRIMIGEPLARIDMRAVDRSLRKNPWIAKAEIGRSWIHGALTLYIEGRKPVASYLDVHGVLRYFDIAGMDFESPLTYDHIPVINLHHDDSESKRAISRFLVLLPRELLDQVQSFSVLDSGEIETKLATTPNSVTLIKWGSPTDIPLKVAVYKRLLVMKENSQAHLFDLRDPLSPITK
jgi:cell division protein FtsQ